MMTVDKALSLYTDLINNGDDIDINYFKNNLSESDYKEFLELIEIINLAKSIKVTNEFEGLFVKMDSYKRAIYDVPQVSSFRAELDDIDDVVEEELNRLFNEEFEDD